MTRAPAHTSTRAAASARTPAVVRPRPERAATRYGAGLRRSLVLEAGDFLFIGPGEPHQPVNLSATEPVRALIARNDPDEQEHVIPYDPCTDGLMM
jgi:uncharacterized RmlC-like cupin family protein